jgi:hypothetical protein
LRWPNRCSLALLTPGHTAAANSTPRTTDSPASLHAMATAMEGVAAPINALTASQNVSSMAGGVEALRGAAAQEGAQVARLIAPRMRSEQSPCVPCTMPCGEYQRSCLCHTEVPWHTWGATAHVGPPHAARMPRPLTHTQPPCHVHAWHTCRCWTASGTWPRQRR